MTETEIKAVETKATDALEHVQATLDTLEAKVHSGWSHWQPAMCFVVGFFLAFAIAHHYHL